MTKKLLIGAGILAGAGLAYYLWKKNQPETKANATGRSRTIKKVYSNGALRSIPPRSLGEGKMWCCSERDTNGNCTQWNQKDIGSPCDNQA